MASLYEATTSHMMQPENRVRYCYQFMNEEDYEMKEVAFRKALHWIGACEEDGSDY